MDPIKDVKKHDFRSAPLSTKEATIPIFRSTRVRLFLFALLLCACGSAMASQPFVIQGPTVVQNNCLLSSFACASISYPAGSPITSKGRVVQANTGNLEFDIPVVSNILSNAAGSLQVTFAVTATATGGASGEVQINSARTVLTGPGSATLKIPVPVEWAESEVRFQITYSVSGTKVICNGKLGCKIYPFSYSNSTTGPNLSSIALGIPAPLWLDGTQQPAGPIPADAFMVLVTPQAAFQLLLQPVGIVYAPVGNALDAKSNLTFTEVSGTSLQFVKSQSSAMGLTQDDRTNYQGNVTYSFSLLGSSLVKLGFNFSGYWDNAVENDQQLSSTTSTLTTNQQSSSLGVTSYPESGEPPFNQITYATQPFWDDLILAVINPHFAVWSYPTGPLIQPIGNDANVGIVELRIRRLDQCVNTPAAIQPTSSTAGTWQPGQAYSVGAMVLVENSYVQVATTAGVSGPVAPTWAPANGSTTPDGGVNWTNESAHLIPVNAMPGVQYDWLASSDCANLAKVDQFWVKKSQSASPYSYVADLSHTGTDESSALTTYGTDNLFSSTYTESSSLQTTSKVTSVGSSSLGVTADVSSLLQDLGISFGVGTTSTTTQTYSNVSTQSLQVAQVTEHVVAATNSVHDTMSPPAEILVNAQLDTYFEGIALQIPSMQLTPPPAAAIRPAMAQVEAPVEENSPSYLVVKPEGTVDQEVLEQAHAAASLRHPDESLPVPEPGKAVLHRPAQH
jgi:hypothetical protein